MLGATKATEKAVRFCGRSAAILMCLGLLGCFEHKERPPHETKTQETGFAGPTAAELAVHKRLLTIDSHIDIPKSFATEATDPGSESSMQVDLPKMTAGGLSGGFFIVFVDQTRRTPEHYAQAQQEAMVKFDAIRRMCDIMYPDRIGLARTAEDIRKIHGEGRLVALIGIENGYVIGKDPGLLKRYYDLGARYMTLAHMGHNDIADSANPKAEIDDALTEHKGLSVFGRQVIAEMNRLGIMVDVSHISKAAMMQAVAASRAPVIASHSAVRALADVPRNLDDEQLKAIAKSGGVVQVVAFSSYVRKQPEKDQALDDMRARMIKKYAVDSLDSLTDEQRKEYDNAVPELDKIWPKATIGEFIDHIDYAVKLIGIDHVGIASDFGGGGGVAGWNNAAESANVTAELMRRGYSETQIAKLWSGNLLRVMEQVEKTSVELQGAEVSPSVAGKPAVRRRSR